MKKFQSILLLSALLFMASCASHNVRVEQGNSGEAAYDFTLPDQSGNMVSLSGLLKGSRGAVIAFYPKDESKN